MNLPPIAVFGHKRSAHLKAALEAIDASQRLLQEELPVYIFCDGAAKSAHEEGVEATREVARAYGKGRVIERERNYGFRNITEGISQLCDSYGTAIIIEDDVLISPDFLPFMCRALKTYADDKRVFMASGFMYFGAQPKEPQTFFLSSPFIWGWATWKRAWDHFEWECSGWEAFMQDKKQRYTYDCLGSIPFSKGLYKTLTGKWKAWGPRWMYANHKAGALTLYPYRSLAWNCGCGGGTHGDAARDSSPDLSEREYYIHGTMQRSDFYAPRLPVDVPFPKRVEENAKGMRSLAITFLKERLRKEKKKRWRLYAKLLYHKCRLFFM